VISLFLAASKGKDIEYLRDESLPQKIKNEKKIKLFST